MGVDKLGVDEMGSRRSGMTPLCVYEVISLVLDSYYHNFKTSTILSLTG